METGDRSDIELAAKLDKDPDKLTVGDVIESLATPKRMSLESIMDNYINGRQDKLDTEEDISRMLPHCTEIEQQVIMYLGEELFRNPKWQKIRREAMRLED